MALALASAVNAAAASASASPPNWRPRTFARWQELITDAFQSSDLQLLIRARDHFDQNLNAIKSALAYPGKQETKRNEIARNGKATVDGQDYKGSAEFNYAALCLSDLLGMDEYVAATILFHAQSQIAEYGNRSLLGTGLALFHTERAAWIECVVLLVQGFINERVPDESRQLFGYMLRKLAGLSRTSGSPNELLRTLLESVDQITAHVATIPQLVDGAAPALPPNPQQSLVAAMGGAATLEEHLEFCDEQLRRLKYAVCLLAQRTIMTSKDALLLLKRLQSSVATGSNDISEDFSACAWLGILMRQSPDAPPTEDPMAVMSTDREFLTTSNTMIESNDWKTTGTKLFAKMAWATYVRGLQALNAALYDSINLTGEKLEQSAQTAINGDVISFIRERLLQVQAGSTAPISFANDNTESGTDTKPDFFVPSLQQLVERFIQRFARLLRFFKARDDEEYATQEQQARLQVAQGAGVMPVAQPAATGSKEFPSFVVLVGDLFRGYIDGGLAFWTDGRLHNFLRMSSEARSLVTRKEVLGMLAALGTGPRSSEHCFEFLGGSQALSYGQQNAGYTGGLSWFVLFQALQTYSQLLNNATTTVGILPDHEVELVRSFLAVLTQVAKFNATARNILSQMRGFESLVVLVLCAVPVKLKAALLEAIAAFCVGKGENIAERVWALVENQQLLQTFNIPVSGIMNSGVFVDLEQTEAPNMVFPATQAFVDLLTTLMETTGGVGPALDNLGSGRRKPGVWPYVDYVVDLVLLKLRSRSYVDPKERWRLQEACLRFVEVCLSTMNLTMPVTGRAADYLAKAPGSGDQIDVSAVLYHAGFQLMTKTLSGPKFKLLEEVLEVVRSGVDAVNRNQAGTPFFVKSCLRALRILYKITQNQRSFVETCSTLSAAGVEPPFASNLPSNITTLDQFVLYRSDVIAKLAGFVGCAVDDEIAWLAVKILHFLSQSPSFGGPGGTSAAATTNRINRLVSIIRQSPDRDAIIQAFADRLDVEDASDDVPDMPRDAPMEMDMVFGGTGLPSPAPSTVPKYSVRAAILDLVLDNLVPQVVAPSIAHLLLGYDVQRSLAQSVLKNPKTDPSVTLNVLHVVVDLIQRGTDDKTEGPPNLQNIFWIRHPNLAEKCYHLLYLLCADPQTSTATLQYLRTESFLSRQLRMLPSSDLVRDLAGDEMEDEEQEDITEADVLLCRAWVLRTAALELRRLSQTGESAALSKLLKVLYESPEGRPGVGTIKMQEVAQRLDASTIDLAPLPRGSRIAEADFAPYLYEDTRGCMVYEVQTLAAHFMSLRRPEERISTGSSFQDRELYQLLRVLVTRNRQYEAFFARRQCVKAWAEIVEVSLSDDCYKKIPGGDKHILLFDLATAVLPRLADDSTDVDMADDLSAAILGIVAKLGNKGASERAGPGGPPSSALSLDMLATLLKQLLSVLVRPGIRPATQGDLATAFLRFVQDVALSAGAEVRGGSGTKRVDAGDFEDEGVGRSSALAIRQTGNLATIFRLVDQSYDKLVGLFSKMALDAPEDIWKATALAALDAVLALYQLHSDNTERIVQYLNQRNLLGLLVDTIRVADPALQQLVHSYETDSLNELYIYQQKMAFFCRLCLKREGSDKLLDNGLIEALTDSKVLDMKPDLDMNPAAFQHNVGIAERYHSIFLPAVRLVGTILSRVGKEHVDAVRRATAFVLGHQDVLLTILKDRSTYITMINLEQLESITFVCSMLAGRGEFGSNRTGFLHFHLVALLAKYSDPARWLPRLKAVGAAQEELHSQPSVVGRKPQTAFEREANRMVRNICRNVLSYCQNLSESRSESSQGFAPTFALSTNIPEEQTYAPITPTLGTLIQYTTSSTDDLAQALEDQKRFTTKARDLSEGLTPAPGELDDVLGAKVVASLDPAEKNKAYAKEVRRMANELNKDILALMYIIEHTLLQLYRHIEFCYTVLAGRADYSSSATTFGTRRNLIPGGTDIEELDRLRRELSSPTSSLRTILDRLSRLDMSQDVGGRQLRSRNTFLQMLLRRSRDLLALDSPADILED